jgi:hypothetical protein
VTQQSFRRITQGFTAAAATALALVLAGAAAGATERATLSPAEQAFAKQYRALVPTLTKAHAVVVQATGEASKLTDAQIATVFTRAASQWSADTKALVALKAPAPEAGTLATIRRAVPLVAADLLGIAKAGRTHSVSAAKSAFLHLERDFGAVGTGILALDKRLGVS